MSKEKMLIILEICYELIAKVHTYLCNDVQLERSNNISDETMDILRHILLLAKRIESEVKP